jgi:hypothetical protein
VEEQVIKELPEAVLADVVALGMEFVGGADPEGSVCDSVAARLGLGGGALAGLDPTGWAAQSGKTLDEIRSGIALAAKKSGWFKDETRGERFGELLVANLGVVNPEGVLAQVLAALRQFMYGAVAPEAEASGHVAE